MDINILGHDGEIIHTFNNDVVADLTRDDDLISKRETFTVKLHATKEIFHKIAYGKGIRFCDNEVPEVQVIIEQIHGFENGGIVIKGYVTDSDLIEMVLNK